MDQEWQPPFKITPSDNSSLFFYITTEIHETHCYNIVMIYIQIYHHWLAVQSQQILPLLSLITSVLHTSFNPCLVTGLFSAIGLTGVVSLLNAFILISLVLLATWGYCRHSGELREVGSKIDEMAHIIWDLVSLYFSLHTLHAGLSLVHIR